MWGLEYRTLSVARSVVIRRQVVWMGGMSVIEKSVLTRQRSRS